jgi:hypothetical protein
MPRASTKFISARIPLGVNQDHWIEFAAISAIIMVSIDRPNPIKEWTMSSGFGKYAVTPSTQPAGRVPCRCERLHIGEKFHAVE